MIFLLISVAGLKQPYSLVSLLPFAISLSSLPPNCSAAARNISWFWPLIFTWNILNKKKIYLYYTDFFIIVNVFKNRFGDWNKIIPVKIEGFAEKRNLLFHIANIFFDVWIFIFVLVWFHDIVWRKYNFSTWKTFSSTSFSPTWSSLAQLLFRPSYYCSHF